MQRIHREIINHHEWDSIVSIGNEKNTRWNWIKLSLNFGRSTRLVYYCSDCSSLIDSILSIGSLDVYVDLSSNSLSLSLSELYDADDGSSESMPSDCASDLQIKSTSSPDKPDENRTYRQQVVMSKVIIQYKQWVLFIVSRLHRSIVQNLTTIFKQIMSCRD
jgi:hypothetical protein